MKQRDLFELFTLAAIWGGSFLLMRVGVPEFGAIATAGIRVIGASLVMLPMLIARGELRELRAHWQPILLIGITNSALPFACFGYAALTLTAGLSSIFNAGTPLMGALIGWLWLRDRPNATRTLGLVIGFVGVFGLAYSHARVKSGADETSAALAVLACIAATVSYGFSANFAKRRLTGVTPFVVAAGSQVGAALALLVPTLWWWPASTPSAAAWGHVALLSLLCTGFAYILYFRLIANVGPANAMTVTFLVPAFGVAWGALFLGETLSVPTLIGCAVILLGTSLATGFLPRPRRTAVASP